MNNSPHKQAELETNNINKVPICDTYEDVHDDSFVREENHDSHEANEEDMVT
jgi:hypothetical protein